MSGLENLLYEVSKLFLTPVLIILGVIFVYALFELGRLLFDMALLAIRGRCRTPLALFTQKNPRATQEDLELHLLKLVEPLRITSRIAPMLGLVATMIPMGPALIAVSSGNGKGIADNLVVAFSAVIIALVSAAITHAVSSIRKRWLLVELNDLLTDRERALSSPAEPTPAQIHGVAHGSA